MKKILPALVVVLTLGVGGAAVYLFQKQNRAGGSTAAVAYLPADTLLLLAIPDVNKTCADWQTTDLYKIWAEPEVQAFLAKPLSKVPPHPGLDTTLAQVSKLGLTNAFVALTALDESNNQPHLLAGFQFNGSSADVDRLLATPKEGMRKGEPAGKADLLNYEGHSIESFDGGENHTLASVYLGNWYFVSNDLALLKSTVDRFDHRGAAAAQPSLDKDPDYAAVLAKLPTNHATLIFARAKPFVRRLYDLAAASGQTVDAKQRAEAEKLRAFGATTGFENGKMRDVVYIYAPGISQEFAKLQMGSLPLTSADTVLYLTSMLNIPEKFDVPGETAAGEMPSAGGMVFLQGLGTMLKAHNVTLEGFRAAFGNEASLHIDWPAGQLQPTLIASLNVRDAAAAGKFVDNFTAALTAEAAWDVSEADGLTFHSMNVPNISAVSPTLTVTSRHLIFGLKPEDVRDAAAREKTVPANFTAGDAYKTASALVAKPNTAFGYIDSRAMFERSYAALKPMALLGVAFVYPQLGDYVDLGKLPDTETISKHLSPTVVSQTYEAEGCRLESVGSFTFGQAAGALFGGAAVSAVPYIQKQFGGSHPGDADDAPDADASPRRPSLPRLRKQLADSRFVRVKRALAKINLRILASVVYSQSTMAMTKKNAFSRRLPDLVTEELVAVLTSKNSYEFKELFDLVHANLRARNAASGGEEMLRLRAYEKLQTLVSRGMVKKTVKKYKGLASLANALPTVPAPAAVAATAVVAVPLAS